MKTLFAAIVGYAAILLSCAAADTNSIIGEWRTGKVLSQLGPSVTAYTFNTNSTFRVATTFTQGAMPAMGATGTYSVVTNRIFMVARGRTNSAAFTFEGETLVLNQGPAKIFKLTKKK